MSEEVKETQVAEETQNTQAAPAEEKSNDDRRGGRRGQRGEGRRGERRNRREENKGERIIIRCCLKKVKKMAAVDILSDARRKKDERSKEICSSCTQCSNGIFHGRKRIRSSES